MLSLRPYQEEAVASVYEHLRTRDDNPCVVLPTGCHAAGHPILMFDGTVRPVEEIRVDDRVMGPNSQPRHVRWLCRGEDELFRIIPRRGASFVVNGDHVLSLMSTNEGKRWNCSQKGGEITNISVRDYLAKSHSWKHLRKLYRVPIEFANSPVLPLPPYILGLLIGDGHIADTIELTTADEPIAAVWDSFVQSTGSRTIVRDHGNRCPTYRMITARGKYNIVTEILTELGLAGCRSDNKFIPHLYLTASRLDRLQLLAGLIDSDGSCHRSGFEITTASRELATDIVFLCRSLGYSANCTSKYSCCQTGADGWYSRIHIDGNCQEVPCRLPRKQVSQRIQKKDPLRTGFTVESCGRGQYFGFELDGDHLYLDGHFIVHHNSGKTPVMATICRDAVQNWQGRVLILAHVKELLEQSAEKLQQVCPEIKFGIYSAGLKKRETKAPVIVAGIQSIYKRACELGPVDLILVDEAHMIAVEGEGMYRQFLADARVVCPHLRIVGFTATPFRLKSGLICTPEHFLNHVCYEVGVRELIVQGYLSPLITKAGREKVDTSGVQVRGGEFVAGLLESLMDEPQLVEAACRETMQQTKDRRSVLIFAAGVRHGQHVVQRLKTEHGVECGFVTGETPSGERDRLLERFKSGDLRFLCNVNVLTTGFDAPNVDCVVLLRPTMSPGLYYQMCLDMETEVLTASGWRRCHEVTVGDSVAAFDASTEEIVYRPAIDKVHRPLKPTESMYGVAAPHLDLRVTDQHTMVVRGRAQTCLHWQFQAAATVAERRDAFTIPIAGRGNSHNSDAPISDAEVEFIGWFLTDGYLNRANNTVTISQSTAKFAAEVRAVLMGCNFGFREYEVVRTGKESEYANGLQFVIAQGEGRGVNSGLEGWNRLEQWLDKDIPEIFNTLSRRQFSILLDAMNLANGRTHVPRDHIRRVMQISVGCRQRMANRLQQLAIERGFRCNVVSSVNKPSSWNQSPQPQWMIYVKRQRVAYIGGTQQYSNSLIPNRSRLKQVDFQSNEWVWCLTTEQGTLVTRRHGKVAIVGNCGRGFRLAPGKQNCLVLDFGGNVLRHGPVDAIQIEKREAAGGEAPLKECPICQSMILAGYATCPHCGYTFPPPEKQKHEAQATEASILSAGANDEQYEVLDIFYRVHKKKDAGPDAPKSMRVDYQLGLNHWQSEFICFEHTGYARQKAEAWWQQRSPDPVPGTAEAAVTLANAGALRVTNAITVRSVPGERFDRIVKYDLGSAPEGRLEESIVSSVPEDDEVPF